MPHPCHAWHRVTFTPGARSCKTHAAPGHHCLIVTPRQHRALEAAVSVAMSAAADLARGFFAGLKARQEVAHAVVN